MAPTPDPSLDFATFIAQLERHGVEIQAPNGGVGFWILSRPAGPTKPPVITAIAFGGYETRVKTKTILGTPRRLKIHPDHF